MKKHEDSELTDEERARLKRRSIRYRHVKDQVFHAINDPLEGNTAARIYAIFSFVLIVANIFLVLYEVQYSDDADLIARLMPLDVFSIVFFGIDYVLRIWTADLLYPKRSPSTARLRYIFSAMGIIDLVSFLPSLIPAAVPLDLRIVKSIRLIRVFRILKVTRYMEGFSSIKRMFRDWGNQMLSSFILLLLFIIIAAVLMFGVEHAAQPDKFDSVVTSLYWAVSTITSTGFGDIAPITPLGRLLGALIMILSIALIAIPAGILSAGFVEESRRIHLANLLGEKSQIRRAVAMGDYDAMTTDDDEIDDEDDVRNDHVYCPYCGHDLGDLTDDDDMEFCPFCGHRFRNNTFDDSNENAGSMGSPDGGRAEVPESEAERIAKAAASIAKTHQQVASSGADAASGGSPTPESQNDHQTHVGKKRTGDGHAHGDERTRGDGGHTAEHGKHTKRTKKHAEEGHSQSGTKSPSAEDGHPKASGKHTKRPKKHVEESHSQSAMQTPPTDSDTRKRSDDARKDAAKRTARRSRGADEPARAKRSAERSRTATTKRPKATDASEDASAAVDDVAHEERTSTQETPHTVTIDAPEFDVDDMPIQVGSDISCLFENPETREELATAAKRIKERTDLNLEEVIKDPSTRAELRIAADEIKKNGVSETRRQNLKDILRTIEEDRVRRNSERLARSSNKSEQDLRQPKPAEPDSFDDEKSEQ